MINHTSFGRHVLAVGGGTEASRLMGLPVNRTIFFVYVISGALAGLAGVILASQFGAGQPIEGIGWELFAIASVVVGGTLLSGGKGSVAGTLAGALLLGVIFTILNFENGMGWISLSAYWQSVVRGLFLLVVVILQSRLTAKDPTGSPKASTVKGLVQAAMFTTECVRADSSAARAMASDATPSSPVESGSPSPAMADLKALIVRT